MWQQVQKNVLTAIFVTIILGIGTAVLTTVKSGWLISQLGGVPQVEFDEEIASLATSAELEAVSERVSTVVTEFESAIAMANGVSETLEDVKARISDLQNYFDGAARIIYFSEIYTVCSNAGCSDGYRSSSSASNAQQLNSAGTRNFDIEVASTHALSEPYYIVTAWYEVDTNEFVGPDGKPIEPIIALENNDTRLNVNVDIGRYSGKAYLRFELHMLIAIQDAIRTRSN